MTGGKVRQYPHFVRLFHTSTPLRSVELSKEWQGVHDLGGGGGEGDNILTLSAKLFPTSTPLRSVSNEVRSEETLDFMASARHGSYSLHHSGGVMWDKCIIDY